LKDVGRRILTLICSNT